MEGVTMIGEDILDLRDVVEAANDPDHGDYAEACTIVTAFVADGLAMDADGFEAYAQDEPTAIHERYFETYAEAFAWDIGAIPDRDAGWPLYCIDWEHAARELAYDYSRFEVDGNTYLVRAY